MSLKKLKEFILFNKLNDGYEEIEEELLRQGKTTAGLGKQSEEEIERTYLVSNPSIAKTLGKFKHYVRHILINDPKAGYVRISEKYINKNDTNRAYKQTIKKDISKLKRLETNIPMSKKEFDKYLALNSDNIVGESLSEVYEMPDTSVILVRHYPNGKVIATGEKEFDNEAAARAYAIPKWADKEVTNDPNYRGKKMLLDNYRRG